MGCFAGLTATFEKQEDERGKQGGRKAGREEGREEGREGKGNYINKLPINRKAAIYLYPYYLLLGCFAGIIFCCWNSVGCL